MGQVPPDPIIDEIREIRHRISAEFGHDPKRYIEHLMLLQQQHRDRLLPPSIVMPRLDSDAPTGENPTVR